MQKKECGEKIHYPLINNLQEDSKNVLSNQVNLICHHCINQCCGAGPFVTGSEYFFPPAPAPTPTKKYRLRNTGIKQPLFWIRIPRLFGSGSFFRMRIRIHTINKKEKGIADRQKFAMLIQNSLHVTLLLNTGNFLKQSMMHPNQSIKMADMRHHFRQKKSLT